MERMKQTTVKICILALLLVSIGTIVQAQQSAFQGTWIEEEYRTRRLEISGTAWSYFTNDRILGAGTARFSTGSAELLLANGSIYFKLTLLAPGLIKGLEVASRYYNFRTGISADVSFLIKKASEKDGRGDYDRAIADYTEAIRLDPNNDIAYNKRGYAHYNKGDYDKAIADFTQAIKLKPNNAYYLYTRGYAAHYNKGDYDRAIADFEAALRINPNLEGARRDLELALQARGR